MIRLTILIAGAVMGLLVAVEAANFAIYHMALKAMPRFSAQAGAIELRIWLAIATASLAWIAAVQLTAITLREIRALRRRQ